MATAFAPEDLKIYVDGELQYSDAYGLTHNQLGLAIDELLTTQPTITMTGPEAVGWYALQYGMDHETVQEVIEGVQDGSFDSYRWDGTEHLKDNLERIIGAHTGKATFQRIRIGTFETAASLLLDDETLDTHFDVVTEPDEHNRDVVSLYPKDGIKLEHRGHRAVQLGSVVVEGITYLDEVKYTDYITVRNDRGEADDNFLASVEVTQQSHPSGVSDISAG